MLNVQGNMFFKTFVAPERWNWHMMIDTYITEVASSCEEKNNLLQRLNETVCSDHGWQRRGFDSLTGD